MIFLRTIISGLDCGFPQFQELKPSLGVAGWVTGGVSAEGRLVISTIQVSPLVTGGTLSYLSHCSWRLSAPTVQCTGVTPLSLCVSLTSQEIPRTGMLATTSISPAMFDQLITRIYLHCIVSGWQQTTGCYLMTLSLLLNRQKNWWGDISTHTSGTAITEYNCNIKM